MQRVENKVALVTGTASNPGLGRSIALTLAAQGAKVVVTDIDLEGAQATADAIIAAGGTASALAHDVTSEAHWLEVIAKVEGDYGQIDILVNNAGIAVLMPISEMTLDDWNRQIDVNMTSVFLGSKYGMASMQKTGGGSIVNISSVAGLIGIPTCVAYGAAKGGVRIMSKSLALEGAASNVRCNSVHPGVIWTNMQAQAGGADAAESETPPPAPPNVPLGRMGVPQDIANCVLYLSSDESNYVTGAEFTVDAGMTAQ